MAIAVDCGCGRQFRVPAANAGRRARCPGCGHPVAVPAAGGAPAAAPAPAPLPDPDPTFEESVLDRLDRIAGEAEVIRRRIGLFYWLALIALTLLLIPAVPWLVLTLSIWFRS